MAEPPPQGVPKVVLKAEHEAKGEYCQDLRFHGVCLARFPACMGLMTLSFFLFLPFGMGISVFTLYFESIKVT